LLTANEQANHENKTRHQTDGTNKQAMIH
jgi:hypothetical protein